MPEIKCPLCGFVDPVSIERILKDEKIYCDHCGSEILDLPKIPGLARTSGKMCKAGRVAPGRSIDYRGAVQNGTVDRLWRAA